jgi:DNA-binding transcriptional ArsR family regulator
MNIDPDKLARMLKVLSVGTRVRIIQLLKDRPLCVNALCCRLDVTQGAVSQHLRVLRDAKLVIDDKQGYFVHYRLNEEAFGQWQEALQHVFDIEVVECVQQKGAKVCAAARTKKKVVRNQRT